MWSTLNLSWLMVCIPGRYSSSGIPSALHPSLRSVDRLIWFDLSPPETVTPGHSFSRSVAALYGAVPLCCPLMRFM